MRRREPGDPAPGGKPVERLKGRRAAAVGAVGPNRQSRRGRQCVRLRNQISDGPSFRERRPSRFPGPLDSRGMSEPPIPHPHATTDVRSATPEEAGDVRAMHAANRLAWDEAAERYEGWFDEAVELIRSGGSQPVPGGAGPHRRPARALPAGDPPPVRRAAGTRCRSGTSARTRSWAWTSARACWTWRAG